MNNVSFNPALTGLPVGLIRGHSKGEQIIRSLAGPDGVIRRCRPISEDAAEGYCLDLSNLPALGRETSDVSDNNHLMIRILLVFKQLAENNGFHFATIDLSQNMISGRSLLQNTLQGLTERVTVLNFNHTQISSNGLYNAKQLLTLRKLCLDYCGKLQFIQSAEVSQLPVLEELSVVGSSMNINAGQMEKMALKFPGLRKLDCTQRQGNGLQMKLLGVTDPATLSTVINPFFYSCGHIMGAEAALRYNQCYVRCVSNLVGRFQPKITRFEKLNERWTVRLLDFNRNDLTDGIFYHSKCGNLFNHETLQKILLVEGGAEGLLSLAKKSDCPGCSMDPQLGSHRMELIKLFPVLQSTEDLSEAAQAQKSLLEESVYMNIT